jgi:hypothetical protein
MGAAAAGPCPISGGGKLRSSLDETDHVRRPAVDFLFIDAGLAGILRNLGENRPP